MRAAFKEWAIVADALGSGRQMIILRKGGIAEGRGGFQLDHPEFLLFPTLYHQQREQVIATAQSRYDEIAPGLPAKEVLRLEYFARVAEARRVDTLGAAQRLRGQHIWREEVVAERFDWGRTQNIFALAVRVFRLPRRIELPMLESYGGCKSWIEIDREIDVTGAEPVLTDNQFAAGLAAFQAALAPEQAVP